MLKFFQQHCIDITWYGLEHMQGIRIKLDIFLDK